MSRLGSALQHLADAPEPGLLPTVAPPGAAMLAASGVVDNGLTPRPHLPYRGHLTGTGLPDWNAPRLDAVAAPALPAVRLDPLTAVQNGAYWQALAREANLDQDVRDGLAELAPK
jgi:hypothetical protein